jgi:hypothetical protein
MVNKKAALVRRLIYNHSTRTRSRAGFFFVSTTPVTGKDRNQNND